MINSSFQGATRDFIFSFENNTVRTRHNNIEIFGRDISNQPVKNDIRTYEDIAKISTGQEDDNTTGCLLGYPLIAINLCKKQAPDAGPKAMQQINLTGLICFSLLSKSKRPY